MKTLEYTFLTNNPMEYDNAPGYTPKVGDIIVNLIDEDGDTEYKIEEIEKDGVYFNGKWIWPNFLFLITKAPTSSEDGDCTAKAVCPPELIDEKFVKKLQAYNLRLIEERDTLKALLGEFHARVQGECPSLLDKDSGGDGRLAVAIEEALRE